MKKRDELIPTQWVLHDYLQVNGGAERLVATLARGLPGFGLAVSGIYSGFSDTAHLDRLTWRIIDGSMRCLPRVSRALLAFGYSSRLIRSAEQVIYSGVYAPLAVQYQQRGHRIFYCHTPPRFAFDRESRYLSRFHALLRPLVRVVIARYRCAYLEALRKMDVVICNSQHVRQRLRAETGLDSRVVYPPIDTERFHYHGQGNYYLSVARLEPSKRVDRIIRAFLAMPDRQLLVLSGGSELQRLTALAADAPNIHFTGWINDPTLTHFMGYAIAAIYIPEDEDFGMSAVEAMAAGKPVIGVNEGGLRESVLHGCTGILLSANPTPEAIVSAVKQLPAEVAATMRRACQERAAVFSTEKFLNAFQSIVAHPIGNALCHEPEKDST
ncbi:MAG: hypothetical protein RL211_1261 [Pseudomonadota bacterium]